MRERPVQRYSEVFGLGAEGQGFVFVVDFQLTVSFLVVEVDNLTTFHNFAIIDAMFFSACLSYAVPDYGSEGSVAFNSAGTYVRKTLEQLNHF